MNKKQYVIVRTYSAGVFAGYITKESKDGQKVTVKKARRLWYWKGAASLSQLAVDGTSDPESCKFPTEVDKIKLTNVIEVLNVTSKAEKIIKSVKVWSQ